MKTGQDYIGHCELKSVHKVAQSCNVPCHIEKVIKSKILDNQFVGMYTPLSTIYIEIEPRAIVVRLMEVQRGQGIALLRQS